MTSTEQRDAEQAARQGPKRRTEHGQERQMRQAIAAERRLTRGRERGDRPAARVPDTPYAYLMQSHD
jgi:hypothetical protein